MHGNDDGKPLGDFLSDVNERLAKVRENLRALREGGGTGRPGGTQASQASAPSSSPGNGNGGAALPFDRWSGRIHALARDLDTVTTGTEGEFLSVGRGLQDFHTRAGRIRDLYVSAASVLSDAGFVSAMDALRKLFDRMNACIGRVEGEAGSVKLRSAIEKTSASLALLSEKHAAAGRAAGRVSELSGEISAGIGEVVASLQYHDITRQQVEHVREALEDLSRRLLAVGPDAVPSLVAEAGDVAEEQSARLAAAGEELGSAALNIMANLRAVSGSAALLAEGTVEMVRGGSNAGRSFLSEMGVLLSSATLAVSALPDSGGNLRLVAEEMVELINSLRLINGNIISILTHLEGAGRTLSDDIEKTVLGMTFHERFKKVTGSVKCGLDEIASSSRALVPAGSPGRGEGHGAPVLHAVHGARNGSVELF